MKSNFCIGGFVLAGFLASACMQKQNTGAEEGGSNLSEVSVNFPTKDKFPVLFGGPGCPDVKLKPAEFARFNTTDGCEAVGRLLDGFKLTITQNVCESGVVGTNKTLTGKSSQNKLAERVVKGCDYDVKLEVGEIDSSKIYFSNGHNYKKILDVPRAAPSQLQLKIELMVTDGGLTIGFPKTETIVTETDSDLSVDISFGRSGISPSPSASQSTAPSASVSPSPGPSGQSTSTPVPNPSSSSSPSGRPDLSTAPPPPSGR